MADVIVPAAEVRKGDLLALPPWGESVAVAVEPARTPGWVRLFWASLEMFADGVLVLKDWSSVQRLGTWAERAGLPEGSVPSSGVHRSLGGRPGDGAVEDGALATLAARMRGE